MIVIYLGNIGSGKTLSVIREIIRHPENKPFTNFKLNMPDEKYHRLRYDDIILSVKDKEKSTEKKTVYKMVINWKFWEDVMRTEKNYSIYLDEFHNLGHSRLSMTKKAVLLSNWCAQVRKLLQDSKDNHLFLISHTITKIDKDWRELAQIIIKCSVEKKGAEVWVHQYYYEGLDDFLMGTTSWPHHTRFLGNPYFKSYNYTELVKFSDADKYL